MGRPKHSKDSRPRKERTTWNQSQDEQLIRLYETTTMKDLESILNKSKSSIHKRCEKLGIKKKEVESPLVGHLDEIIGLRKKGASKAYIAKHFGCSTPAVINFLKKNGIE